MSDFNEIKTPDMHEPWDGQGLPAGAKAGLFAFIGVLLGAAIPYFVAPLFNAEDDAVVDIGVASIEVADVAKKVGAMRAWLPGDNLPFAHAFGGGHGHAEATAKCAPGALAATFATGSDGEPEVPEVAPLVIEPSPVEVIEPSAADAGNATVSPSVADPANSKTNPDTDPKPNEPPKVAPALSRIHIPDSTWDGLSTFVEDPHDALRPFYAQLAKVALKEANAMVRISHYGDSAIAADGMPSSARRLLQHTFGDGGHGFSLAAASNNWYRRKDITWTSQAFQTEVYISDDAKDQRYGFAGTAAIGYAGARATWKTVEGPEGTVGTKASRFQVYYQAAKGGGRIAVTVDGVENQVIDTESETREDRVATIEVPDGPHTFEVKNAGGGKTKIYGAVIERATGVVYDGLGTIGARDTRWLNIDGEHAKNAIRQRGTDLGVFMYGGNQLEDKVSMARYQESLTEVVKLWHTALDGKSCMLMSSIDHGERYRGRVRTVPRLVDIMKVQREVALANGCAWFSLYDAMGGNGSIGDWFDQGLAEGDLAHPTSKGAIILGQLFYKALMRGFADYIKSETAAELPK